MVDRGVDGGANSDSAVATTATTAVTEKNDAVKRRSIRSSDNGNSFFYATGRRKTASAKVWLRKGSGKFSVNGVDVSSYLARSALRNVAIKPLVVTEVVGQYDVISTVSGSGLSGQAGAIAHGVSQALDLATGKSTLHSSLKNEGLLTRDNRMVESKKYGRKKARKRFQFSKR